MKELTNNLVALCEQILKDSKADTKAAHQRIRKATSQIAKIGKEYRKASIEADKQK